MHAAHSTAQVHQQASAAGEDVAARYLLQDLARLVRAGDARTAAATLREFGVPASPAVAPLLARLAAALLAAPAAARDAEAEAAMKAALSNAVERLQVRAPCCRSCAPACSTHGCGLCGPRAAGKAGAHGRHEQGFARGAGRGGRAS
jgi:hypothetical protein